MLSGTESQLHTRIMERTKRVCVPVLCLQVLNQAATCPTGYSHCTECTWAIPSRKKMVLDRITNLFLGKKVLDKKTQFFPRSKLVLG